MTYAICFDYPETPGEPVFAGWVTEKGGYRSLGWAPTLATAIMFEDEDEARRTLENGYGPAMRACGTVVEVGE